MSSAMARSPYATFAFAQLAQRLKITNARYRQIAYHFRRHLRLTYHAKRKAYDNKLCIDTRRARNCPAKYVSVQPPPIIDRSAETLDCTSVYASTEDGGDAYMRPPTLRNLPEVERKAHRRRTMLRLPPLHLQVNIEHACCAPRHEPPNAPRLAPRQLPEDENGVEDMMLGSAYEPIEVRAYSGLCITIPPRGLKRKRQGDEDDDDAAEQPKRYR